MTTLKKRPTREEIFNAVADTDKAFKDDLFSSICNEQPHESWLKQNDGLPYLPIDKVQFLLTFVSMGQWKREILSVSVMVNSIAATVRLWVRNPYTGEWTFHDGSGAVPIQLDKSTPPNDIIRPSDISRLKSLSIQKNLPAAVSFALSNAAACFGKLFGGGLNIPDSLGHTTWLPGEKQENTVPGVTLPVNTIIPEPTPLNNIQEQSIKIEL